MSEKTDAELVAACRAGDAEAWNLLVERFSRYVFAITTQAFRLRPHDAEDVFQEVFARVYERLGTLRDETALRPWIAQLTRNACIDRLRAGGRDELERLDEAFIVREALVRLSPDCREILDRFFSRDESYRTIGRELQLPSGTIASRISRCLGRLRMELEGRSGVVPTSSEQVAR